MHKRMITTLHELMVQSTKGVEESGLIYAVIMGVVWLMVLSKVPRRRKKENFNMTKFAHTYQKDAISGTTFKANGMKIMQTKKKQCIDSTLGTRTRKATCSFVTNHFHDTGRDEQQY